MEHLLLGHQRIDGAAVGSFAFCLKRYGTLACPLGVGELLGQRLPRGGFGRDAGGQGAILSLRFLVGADELFEARHLGFQAA
ncbi:hypothetical protein [Sphingobium cloacae]|uniref:hypothetical protein n=1 Tax=Sphingobium cloacae TaxID=120107 RepID=UPI0012ED1E5A|nr:hypothetical protein [Sphingobium cloacae]